MSGQTYTIYLIEDHRMKPYVGVTSKTPEERLRAHKTAARGGRETHLYRAMRKYGTDKFQVIPLDTAQNSEKAFSLEQKWVSRLGTYEDWGYNMTPGGNKLGTGEKHPWFGENHDEETKKRMSVNSLGKNGGSEISAQDIAEIRWMALNTDLFNYEIADRYSVSTSTISRIVRGVTCPHIKPQKPDHLLDAVLGPPKPEPENEKIPEKKVAEIKWLSQNRKMTYSEICDRYDVCQASVSKIKNEKRRVEVEPQKPTNYNA